MFRTIQRLYFANRDEQIVCSYNNNIFESLRLPLDKISCTRQFESKLSLRSFAKSLAKGSFFENLPVLPYLFSKTYPSFLTFFRKPTRPSLPLRKAPPLISVFFNGLYTPFGSPVSGGQKPQGRRGKPLLLVARNRYALRLAGHQSPRHILRDGTALL